MKSEGTLDSLDQYQQKVADEILGTYELRSPEMDNTYLLRSGSSVCFLQERQNKHMRRALRLPFMKTAGDLEAVLDLEKNAQRLSVQARGEYQEYQQWRPIVDFTFPNGETFELYAEKNQEFSLTANGSTKDFNDAIETYLVKQQPKTFFQELLAA